MRRGWQRRSQLGQRCTEKGGVASLFARLTTAVGAQAGPCEGVRQEGGAQKAVMAKAGPCEGAGQRKGRSKGS